MLANALVQNRDALAGPFLGPTLPVNLPRQLDQPALLQQWAAGPRQQICETAALQGIHFRIDQAQGQVDVMFTDLDAAGAAALPLARLKRPTAAIFTAQCDLVANYAELRADRGSEILAQAMPSQVGFWAPIIGMQPHLHTWTQQLVAIALSMTVLVEMRLKHMFACPRPVTLSPQLQPLIPTPGHGSWPSGHSTESFMVAGVLQALLQAATGQGERYQEQLQRLAARVAVNRTVAGLHYPVDSAAGRLLGTTLAEFFVARCTGSTALQQRGFDGTAFRKADGSALDFDARVSMSDNRSGYYTYGPQLGAVTPDADLAFVWGKAAAEWAA